jgi:hypothetical protein
VSDTLTPREERIQLLLEWWTDVLEGWQEGGRGGDELGVRMMGRAWNHPSYRELERCLIALRDEENATYWHVREQYQAHRRMVLQCPRCLAVSEVAAKHFDDHGNVRLRHKHDGPVFFVRKAMLVVNHAVRPDVVLAGVRWIGREFRLEPFIPDELLGKEKAA